MAIPAPNWRKRVVLDLTGQAFDDLEPYHLATNPQGTVQDTLRELVLIGLRGVEGDPGFGYARRSAHRQALSRARDIIREAIIEAAHRLEADAALGDS